MDAEWAEKDRVRSSVTPRKVGVGLKVRAELPRKREGRRWACRGSIVKRDGRVRARSLM